MKTIIFDMYGVIIKDPEGGLIPFINRTFPCLKPDDVNLREKFMLNDFFDAIIVSGDVKFKKPDPQIYNLMLNRLAQPASDCTFIDDRRRNLAAARALGIETVLFNSRKVAYNGKTVNNFGELVDMLIPSA